MQGTASGNIFRRECTGDVLVWEPSFDTISYVCCHEQGIADAGFMPKIDTKLWNNSAGQAATLEVKDR